MCINYIWLLSDRSSQHKSLSSKFEVMTSSSYDFTQIFINVDDCLIYVKHCFHDKMLGLKAREYFLHAGTGR